jgi:hypothetical protein
MNLKRIPRYWFSLYAFVSSESALFSMIVYQAKMISYPVRPLPDSLNMSLYFNGFIYPLLVWTYLLFRKKRKWTLLWALLISLLFTFLTDHLFVPLGMVKYIDWDSSLTLLLALTHLACSEIFLLFYQKMTGSLR